MVLKNNIIKNFLISLSAIFLVVIILFTPLYYYLFNLDYYLMLYQKNMVFSRLEYDDVVILTESIFNFFRNGSEIEAIELKTKNINFFTPDEISHLDDVRILLNKIFIAYYGSIVLLILLIILLIEKKIFKFFKKIGSTFIISSAMVIFLLSFFYFFGKNFVIFFERFHLIFFPQGNYIFPADSLIITLFPFGFFYDFFLNLVFSSVIMSIGFLITGVFLIYLEKFKNKKSN